MAHHVYGIGQNASAANLHTNYAPGNLNISLDGSNPDQYMWEASYNEEYNGLRGLDVFTEISTAQYHAYLKKHCESTRAIPTMNILTIKPDMIGNPNSAKSLIVALGNLEQQLWSQEDNMRLYLVQLHHAYLFWWPCKTDID